MLQKDTQTQYILIFYKEQQKMADMRPCNSVVSNLEKVDGNRH